MKRNSIKIWQPADLVQLELQRGFCVNRPVPRHWHEEYQFVYVESGAGDLTYRGRDFLTPPDSLFIVHPGEVHSNRAFESDGCNFRTIFLKISEMENVVSQLKNRYSGLPFFASPVISDAKTIREFVGLHISLEHAASTLERETRLQTFLAGLVTNFAESRTSPRHSKNETRAIKDARDYLIANYEKNVSLEKLARIANLSSFHFNRVFSRELGIPPHEFQVQLRISEARKSLRNGTDIAQVAFQTGFADQSHLTRHFKRVIGVTPGQYRYSNNTFNKP